MDKRPEAMTLAELKSELKTRNISWPSWAKKARLVGLLRKETRSSGAAGRGRPKEKRRVGVLPNPAAKQKSKKRSLTGQGRIQTDPALAEQETDSEASDTPEQEGGEPSPSTGKSSQNVPMFGSDELLAKLCAVLDEHRRGQGQTPAATARSPAGPPATSSAAADPWRMEREAPGGSQQQTWPRPLLTVPSTDSAGFSLESAMGPPMSMTHQTWGMTANYRAATGVGRADSGQPSTSSSSSSDPSALPLPLATGFQSHRYLGSGAHQGNASSNVPLFDYAYNQGPKGVGVPSDSLPRVDIVTPSIKKDIIMGKDINMAALLIPGSTGQDVSARHLIRGSEIIALKPLTDSRLNKPLTLPEFIKAFGIYKNVMVDAYPIRRAELDSYLQEILDMATKFPSSAFYEYHKAFSARAAALLLNNNVKVDWSVKDTSLFCSVFAGHRATACSICNSLLHQDRFFPQVQNNTTSFNRNDRTYNSMNRESFTSYGNQQRVYHLGKEVCNNFNQREVGCIWPGCTRVHVCARYKSKDHSALACKVGASNTPKVSKPQPSKA